MKKILIVLVILLSASVSHADVVPGYNHLTEELAARLDSAMAISYEDPDVVISVLSSIAETEDCATYKEAVRYVVNTMPDQEDRILNELAPVIYSVEEQLIYTDESEEVTPFVFTEDGGVKFIFPETSLFSSPSIDTEDTRTNPELENPLQVSGN